MSMIDFDDNNGYEDEKLKTVFHDDEVVEEEDEQEAKLKKDATPIVIESQIIDESINDISPQVITKEMRSSFLDYAMSVIVARALPDAYDGLKPVHRRILYSMAELGIDYNKAHKKSARIVGETMGKYHPHGDAAIYEAMVRMAQPFSMRYLLVEGHGNFGSIDGDGAAAMRYTEARLSKLSSFMVAGIEKNSVDFVDNYDATEKEPVVLPARFPNLLVSGSTGIAVGMATNIPPHNIGEVIDAVIALAKNPEATIEELMLHIKGPDFPTGAIILGTEGIKEAYTTGNGSITTRSKAEIQTNANTGRQRIIISEIPYMVNKAKLVEKIALLVKDRVIEGIISIRDESNREGIRIVFDIGKNAVAEVVLNKLYKLTPLQTNFGVNFIALDQGQPKTMTLKTALECYIQHQKNVVLRKSQFDLEKAEKRAHILIGLKIAINNIDEVIQIIKKSSSDLDAQQNLIKRFGLSEDQSKAITEMRLGRLTGLAIEKMDLEIEELKVQIFELGRIINQPERLIQVIIDEQNEVKSLFADNRRTSIIEGVAGSINEEDLIPQRDIAITLSVKGYVKRMPLEEYRTQRRGGVGTKAITTYEDDDVRMIITTTTHTDLLIFTKSARVFRIRAYKIPSLSKQAKGIPFINLIDMDKEDEVVSLLPINEYPEDNYLMTISRNGILKKTRLSEYERINKNGKYALGLKEGDELFKAMVVKQEDELVIGSREGKVVRFKSSDVRSMGRTAAGVKGINLSDSKTNYVVGVDVASTNGKVLSIGDYGYGKMTEVDEYRQTKRGAKGVKTIDVKKTGKLVSIMVVDGREDIIVLTSKGVTIRTTLTQVSTISRSTKGVTIIKLEEGVKIRSVAMIDVEKVEEEVERAIERTQEMNVKALRSDSNLNTQELSENDNIEDHQEEK